MAAAAHAPWCFADPPVTAELIEVRKIWGRAPHNAFTDLVRWHDRWYCAFREGQGHAGDIGRLRVITSADGRRWESTGVLGMQEYDLRDAALSITPDDRLMLTGGVQQSRQGRRKSGTFVSYSSDGQAWSEPQIVIPPGRWLWRVTWHQGKAYGVSYATPKDYPYSSLLVTDDGRHFKERVSRLLSEGRPTEARLRFDADGTCYCLHRRDGEPNSAMFGRAAPPYTQWQWSDLGAPVGGPNFIQLPGGQWIGAGRLQDEGSYTGVFLIDVDAQSGPVQMTPVLRLPSEGDSSYPGMVWHDGKLWLSYYSSHEDHTSIYLAEIKVEPGP